MTGDKPTYIRQLLRSFSIAASYLVTLIGLVVLLGWWFGWEGVIRLHPDFVSMKANTALGFVFSGTALWMLLNRERRKFYIPVATFLSLLVVVIGLVNALSDLVGVEISLDQLLVKESVGTTFTWIPGRMAMNSAVNFMITGTALMLLIYKSDKRVLVSQFLALFIFLYTLMPILGYVFDAPALYGFSIFTKMALHTAIAFVFLALAIMVAAPDMGINLIFTTDTVGGYMSRRLFPLALLMPVFLVAVRLTFSEQDWVESIFYAHLVSLILILLFMFLAWRFINSIMILDAKHSETEKKASNRLLLMQEIIRYDPNAIAVLDDQLRFVFVSDRFLFDYQLNMDEVIGKTPKDIEGRNQERWEEKFRIALTGQVLKSELDSFKGQSGITEFTRWECRPWHLANGHIGGVILYSELITERIKANQELEKNRKLLQSIIDNTTAFIYMNDTEGNFLMLNKPFMEFLGGTSKSLIGKKKHEVMNQESAYQHRENDLEVIRRRESLIFEEENIEADGVHYYYSTKFPLFDEHNEVYAVCGISVDFTERKRMEKELEKNEERLTNLLSNLPGMAYQCLNQPSWPMLYLSEGCYELTGYTNIELIEGDLQYGDLIHPDDQQYVVETIDECNRKRKPFNLEYRIRTKDGLEKIVWEKGRLISDASEKEQVLEGFIMDITERKTMEIEIRRKNEFIQTVLDKLPIGIAMNRINEGETVYMNNRFEEIYGWKKQVLQNVENFFKHVYPDEQYRSKLKGKIMADIASGDARRMHWENIKVTRSDGSNRIVNALNIPLPEQNIMVSTVMDITELKEAEAKIARANQLLRDHVENTPLAVVEWDKDLMIQQWSERAEQMFGWEIKDIVSKGFDEVKFIHLEDKLQVKNTLSKLKSGKIKRSIISTRLFNRGMQVMECVWYNSAVFDDMGDLISILTLIDDVTEQKKIARQIQTLNTELEKRVEQRTAQLQAANQELEAFSYSVSHDLRAPLRAIDGFTRILVEDHADKFGDEGLRISNLIRENAQRMGVLIDDLLAFSRLSRQQMKHTNIDMNKLVETVYNELTSADQRKAITFNVKDLCHVKGDESLIRQVLVNLISNAIKFTSKKDNPVIQITCARRDNYCEFCLADNGVGFDMQYLDKLFTVFQRLHSVRDFEGTGIGLATVKRIVARHGGQVRAEAEVGKGASFYFSLPLITDEKET